MPIPRIPGDYEPPEFEAFAPGKYSVCGVKFFTTDEEGTPIFVAQSGARLVARYRTIRKDDEDGPPGSVDRGQLPLLVKAFGIDPKELPPYNLPNQRLIMAERLINSAAKEVVVEVGDGGWISRMPGMELPAPSYFRVKYKRCSTFNELGEPSWIQGKFGRFASVVMEVVGDAMGKSTPFDHVRQFEPLGYALSVNEDGVLEWETTESGAWSAGANRFSKFLAAVCGDGILDESFEDLNNIMPEVHDYAVKMDRACLGTVERSQRGRKRVSLKLESLVPITEDTVVPEEGEPEEEALEDVAVKKLYDALNELFEGQTFGANGKLTSEARAWWKAYVGTDPADSEEVAGIGDFCKKYGIPRSFEKMTAEHVDLILGWMRSPVTVEAVKPDDDIPF